MKPARPLDVAIVGMACRFPGAGDLCAYWANILAGRDAIGEVPADRWDPAVFVDPDSKASDRVTTARGGYLDAPIPFDPAAHGIMPGAVDGGEPEQFLVLDAARAALADAGMGGGVPDGRKVEVVVGRGNYFNRGNLTRLQHGRGVAQTVAILRALHPEWSEADFEAIRADLKANLPPFDAATVPGQLTNATAGRVANRLDFSGASFVVDAASASSLVALDLGARALVERRADLAIVGAVYLGTDVDFPMVFSRLGALSRTGAARPFARGADGTLPGEGVGVVVLKRLADAERAEDRIYAVVKGVGLASDGRGPGLATPDAKGHARSIRRAYRQAGVDPATVGLLEGHGLGVPASDRAELRALRATFPPSRRRAIGAVSSMIGHAMPAAGMAGLIKMALALHHRMLPPTLHADGEAHPLLTDDKAPGVLNAAARPWIHGEPDEPRRAGVNAFGFSGISAHAILEEHAESADAPDAPGCLLHWDSEAILLGAPDRATWLELARALLGWLDHEPDVALKDLAATLNAGQPAFPFRVGLVVTSLTDLRDRLRAVATRLADPNCRSLRDARGTYFQEEGLAGPGRLAFLFPGEGSQYPGMLADLCPHFPEVRALFDTADRLAIAHGNALRPGDQLFGPGAGSDQGLWGVGTAVNAVLSSQWALYHLLTRLGLKPDAVGGHSSGEILALAAAGATRVDSRFEDRIGGLGSVFERLEASGDLPAAVLLAAGSDLEKVKAACEAAGVDAPALAMDNCPHQVVLAAATGDADAVEAALKARGILCERLPFGRAYHTPAFESALKPLRAFFADLPLRPQRVPLYSAATAARMPDDVEIVRDLAVAQWARPVRFRGLVEAMHADGVRLFVEVGARGNLTGFVEDTLRGRPHLAVAANLPRRSGLAQLNHLVASLFAQGVPIRPEHLYARRRPERIDLAAPPRRARPVPSLAVGAPELRLSTALVETLRSRTKPPWEPPPAANGHHANGSANGHHHPEPAEGVNRFSDPGGTGGLPTSAFEARPLVGKPPVPPGSVPVPAHLVEPIDPEPAAEAVGFRLPDDLDDAEADAAMAAYLRTMRSFLDTQREVMEAYLAADEAGPFDLGLEFDAHPDITFEPAPSPAAPEPAVAHRAATIEAPAEPAPAPSVEAILIERLSARTGYPAEMLRPDLDLEADLGIDSIKRVEIFGDLRERGAIPAAFDMDRLSRCRTLRQVVAALPASPDRAAGPWLGAIRSLVPGRELVAVRHLVVAGDPVAEHHTLGGRRVSAVDPTLKGLPVVPFAAMAEMLAQAGAALVAPGRVLVALRDVQAHRWIKYEEEPVALEIRGRVDPAAPDEVRVEVYNRGTASLPRPNDGPVVAGVAVFGPNRPDSTPAGPFALADAGPCRFTAESVYGEQWLFHGPAFQAIARMGASAPKGIEGTLRVPPRAELLGPGESGAILTDVVVLDAFTQLLGAWGLDKMPEGDVMFPLRMGELAVFGDDLAAGSEVECRVTVDAIDRHKIGATGEIVGPDGRTRMRISGWEDWRFYWPGRYRDQFRQPDRTLVGERLDLPGDPSDACAVWLEPPADMGRPVWRDVLEWDQLGPAEREACRDLPGDDARRTARLWGRVAAKEAARRLWLDRGGSPIYPADLVIEPDGQGRPVLRSLFEPGRDDLPAVSIAHAEGVAVALAALAPETPAGIDVALIADRGAGFEAVAFSASERDWLDGVPATDLSEWVARLWCAKEAAGKATGLGLVAGPGSVEVVGGSIADGVLSVAPGPALRDAWPLPGGAPLRVSTGRRGEYAWAWTSGGGAKA